VTTSRARSPPHGHRATDTPSTKDEGPSLTRTQPDRVNVLAVTTTRRLSIELEHWSTRPIGHLSDEAGRTVGFDGWVSLAAALESICEPEAHEERLER
jgi:hypothetical protein